MKFKVGDYVCDLTAGDGGDFGVIISMSTDWGSKWCEVDWLEGTYIGDSNKLLHELELAPFYENKKLIESWMNDEV